MHLDMNHHPSCLLRAITKRPFSKMCEMCYVLCICYSVSPLSVCVYVPALLVVYSGVSKVPREMNTA